MSDEPWTETWEFDIADDLDKKSKVRGYLQFGGRLNSRDHFAPFADAVCKKRGISIVKIEQFSAKVDLTGNSYVVQASVTLKNAI